MFQAESEKVPNPVGGTLRKIVFDRPPNYIITFFVNRYVEKVFQERKLAKLIIPVCSTFQGDLHPPIGGHHPFF